MDSIISYVSTANHKLSDFDIIDLLNFTKFNNDTLDITGILMYTEGNFFQVLEGQKNTVEMIFEKIKKDYRHHNIIKMLDKKIIANSFSKFHQQYKVIHDKEDQQKELQQFLEQKRVNNPRYFKSIAYLSHKFIKTT